MELRNGTYRWAICQRCEGHGTHLNPNIGQHAYGAEEFADAFPDDDSLGFNPREEYFKHGGIYDVSCMECEGTGKVKEPIISALTFAEKRELVMELRRERWRREAEAERRWEARMLGEEY